MKRNKKINFNALLQFLNRTRKEIDRCAEAKAYLAGCVLLGSMTEYLLMAMLRIFPYIVYQGGRKIGDNWTLKALNEFARECGWFDNDVFEAAERIRLNRNLLHPNWYASRKPKRITRNMLKARENDFEKVYECITGWVI